FPSARDSAMQAMQRVPGKLHSWKAMRPLRPIRQAQGRQAQGKRVSQEKVLIKVSTASKFLILG
ncbi:MAG: hypothetical protein OEV25_04930, partial [Deltaproteobacteria bacterium]|nr:hypothetical protein [Deltaproteobacteria bacterium]